MNKIPMLEKFAAQSLVELDGELVFSKEKFAELIVRECADLCESFGESGDGYTCSAEILEHFGVKE